MLQRPLLWIGITAMSAGLGTLALAATLDVKTGLWEVTSEGQSSGMPPIPAEALARMTPQQRAQFEASMQQSMAQMNQRQVGRSCVTEKTLQRGMDFSEHQRAQCKRTVLTSTSSVMEVREECTGDQQMTGTFRFEAADRQTMHGTIDMTMTDGTHQMTMHRTMQGVWLGADCGSVAPAE